MWRGLLLGVVLTVLGLVVWDYLSFRHDVSIVLYGITERIKQLEAKN